MGQDLAQAETARPATAKTRGVGPGRLQQDVNPVWPTAAEMTWQRLAEAWSPAYHLGYDGQYTATRAMTDPPPPVTARTLEGFESAIRADYARWCDLGAGTAR